MNTTERAQQIRETYKKLGWTSRDISVKTRYYAGGSSIDVTIKTAKPNAKQAQRIAEQQESIRRCEMTGDILFGGNRYVHVRHSDAAKKELGAPYLEDMREAIQRLQARAEPNLLIPIGDTELSVGFEFSRVGNSNIAIWGESHRSAFYANSDAGLVEGAFSVALLLQEGEKS